MLSTHIGTIFEIKENEDRGGEYWWFKNPSEHIKYPNKKLTDRAEETITSLLRRKVSVTLDEVLADIFTKYPNGLTPDIKSVDQILKKFANKSGGKWVYKRGNTEKDFTDHTEMLFFLSEIGKKMGYEIYIGKREQPESYCSERLSKYADVVKLDKLDFVLDKRVRIEMMDMLWINDDKVEFAIEVENSTKFTSGIQRASNLGFGIDKIMVLPNKRKKRIPGY